MLAARLVTVTLGLVVLGGCATPRSPEGCRETARQAYRRCVNPTFRNTGGAVEQTRSDEAQACQAAYQQALTRCDGPPEIPVPEIGTSTSAG